MDKLQWLKQRQKGIGGSDVGAIMGVSRWKSAFQVYVEKTSEITEIPEAPEAAYWGNQLEEMVAKEFSKKTGKKVRKVNHQLTHSTYPFMVANIDRRVVGENSILECNTTSVFGKKEWEGEEIPGSYILQYQHYMAVTNADKCYVAVLIGGQKFKIKEILRDEELIQMIIAAEKNFWTGHVEKKVPPAIDGSEAADMYLKNKYPKSDSTLKVGLKAEFKDKITQYISLKDNIKILDKEAKTLENCIKLEMGTAEKGIIDNFVVNWKSVYSSRIDSKMLKEKYSDIYKEVCMKSVSRRFEIKAS